MPSPSPEQVVDIVLNRRQVYNLDTDSRIREAVNCLTARALFELLARLDDHSPDFPSHLSTLLRELPVEGISGMIGFHTGDLPSAVEHPEIPELHEKPSEHYLRLVFSDEQAAFYQFHLFPNLDVGYVCSASQKRAGAVQHLRIQLSRTEALQTFIESCRSNPHLLRVEQSTSEEFEGAPSNGV